MDKNCLHETTLGVPQGGSISPIIANMTLDGLETTARNAAKAVIDTVNKKKNQKTSPWVHTVRYADDFVITCVSSRILDGPIRKAVDEFLATRGLSLNQDKTH